MIKGEETKSLPITKEMVWTAYKKVKSNGGSAGVDRVSLQAFEEDLERQLYKLWNRLSSGSYFPPAVRAVEIPKKDGRSRQLGIPTVGDRVAQQVVKTYLEPRLEAIFHESSYGYRPLRSAHEAVALVGSNVKRKAWVIDMDIKSFFDEVDHALLLKGLAGHVSEGWILLYIRRWLESPVQEVNGALSSKGGKGTPQGGVISPLLGNLFLHYALDQWMSMYYPGVAFVRYADDVIIHCESEEQAQQVLGRVKTRLASCNLELHEGKTQIVYCQDHRREKKHYKKKFDFLGFSFQPRSYRSKKNGKMCLGYWCAISPTSKKHILSTLKATRFHRWSTASLEDLVRLLNPKLRGWVNYFGKFGRNELSQVFRVFHQRLVKWVLNRYKSLRGRITSAYQYLKQLQRGNPGLFYHWEQGYLNL